MAYATPARALTFGALALSFLGLSAALPSLVAAVFSGTVADRSDRRKVMVYSNLLGTAGTAGIALILFVRPEMAVFVPGPAGFYLPLWVLLLYPSWAAVTVSTCLFRPAFNASVPRLVEVEDLGIANGLVYSIAAVLAVIAQFSAGSLDTAMSPVWALTIPLGLAVSTQFALARLPGDWYPRRESPRRRFLQEARQGYRFLWRQSALLEITLVALVFNFLSAVALVELSLYVVAGLNLHAAFWLGTLTAGATAGSATGLLLINSFRFERVAGRLLIGLAAVEGLTVVALAFVHSIWLALPDLFLYGMVPGMVTTIFLSLVQATVPNEILGRVFAADEVGSYALIPVGQWAGGILTFYAGLRSVFVIAGAGMFGVAAVAALFFVSLRRLSYEPRAAESAPATPTPRADETPA